MSCEDKHDHQITAIRKDLRIELSVRKMDKDEMPDDGITYYADTDGTIYEEDELEVTPAQNQSNKVDKEKHE